MRRYVTWGFLEDDGKFLTNLSNNVWFTQVYLQGCYYERKKNSRIFIYYINIANLFFKCNLDLKIIDLFKLTII